MEKYGDQLLGARTNEEYKGLQQQIASTKTRIGTIEDRILALMEKADELEEKLADRKRTFAERSAVCWKPRRPRSGRRPASRKRSAISSGSAGRLPSPGSPKRSRPATSGSAGARRGIAVAPVRDERCSACNVRLRPQLLEEIHVGQAILACETCARILFFEAEPAAKSA